MTDIEKLRKSLLKNSDPDGPCIEDDLMQDAARAPDVWYPWRWLARVEIWDGHLYSTQWCVSSEEVRRACRSGSVYASGQAR